MQMPRDACTDNSTGSTYGAATCCKISMHQVPRISNHLPVHSGEMVPVIVPAEGEGDQEGEVRLDAKRSDAFTKWRKWGS